MARVIELVDIAGAYGGRLLAEMGHDVIRVEPPEGDALRRLGPFLKDKADLETGAYHQFLNAGKRSLALSVEATSDREVLLRLLATADVLLGNTSLPVRDDELLRINPRLVAVRLENDLPELCVYAKSGLLALTGHPEGRPMLLGGHALYAATGAFAAVGALSALIGQAEGSGQFVDLSVLHCLESLGEQGVIAETVTGEKFERRGYRGAVTAISGAFRCSDGYAMLSVPPQPENWARFMDWVQDPILSQDATLADEAERRAKKDFVIDRLENWTERFSKEDLVVQSQERHTPAAPVSVPSDLVDDPQLRARGFLRELAHPDLGTMLFPVGALATLKGAPPVPAPRLGQHNSELLAELGCSPVEPVGRP